MMHTSELPRFSFDRTAENRGGSNSKDRVPRISPNPPPEGGGMDWEPQNRGVRRGSFPENRGNPRAGLWEQKRQLEAELGQCVARLEAAERAAEPMIQAHAEAREHLLALMQRARPLHNPRSGAAAYPYGMLRGSYEAWRITSFEAYPFKAAVRDLANWHGAILKELADLNAEIDKPKSPRFSRKRSADNRGELLL